MPNIVKVDPRKNLNRQLKRFAREAAEDDCTVVLEFTGDVPPEKLVKFFEWANDEYSVTAVVRHAELEEYVTSACAGAAVGGAIALLAKAAGAAVSWPVVLAAAAGGALFGALSTPLHIKIWRRNGVTKMRLAPSK